jgi:hypothetical protein
MHDQSKLTNSFHLRQSKTLLLLLDVKNGIALTQNLLLQGS